MRQDVAADLLLLLLNKVHVRKHSVSLEPSRELGRGCGVEVKAGQRNQLEYESGWTSSVGYNPRQNESYPSFPSSQTKFFRFSFENPCADQLKLGLRLYTNHLRPIDQYARAYIEVVDTTHLPGNFSRILRAKPCACSRSGRFVSSHIMSAYGANASSRLIAASMPPVKW